MAEVRGDDEQVLAVALVEKHVPALPAAVTADVLEVEDIVAEGAPSPSAPGEADREAVENPEEAVGGASHRQNEYSFIFGRTDATACAATSSTAK